MSSARTNPGADHGIYPGDAIAAEMHAARLPSEPRQFEFWFAYKNGRNAALNAAAERIENITKRLNETVPESGVPMG